MSRAAFLKQLAGDLLKVTGPGAPFLPIATAEVGRRLATEVLATIEALSYLERHPYHATIGPVAVDLPDVAPDEIVRVFRLVEYVGPVKRVRATLSRSLPDGEEQEWNGLRVKATRVPQLGPSSRIAVVKR